MRYEKSPGASGAAIGILACIVASLLAGPARAQPDRQPVGDMSAVERIDGIEFARVGDEALLLDLYMPKGASEPPLLVWVHGGGWMRGSRSPVPTVAFVNAGYAMASVDYRLSGTAPFPAQIHDVKAAIRFLRARADAYGYDTSRIGILGFSAGGHLAALAGVTNGDPALEGEVGAHLDRSSDVAAVVSFSGASNLTTILDQSTPFGLNIRVPALEALLGGPPEERAELARAASPVFYVDSSDPPLLLLHGDQDPQMPINQAHELNGAYEAEGLSVRFEVVHGAGHGGAPFYDAERTALVTAFLDEHLRASAVAGGYEPVTDWLELPAGRETIGPMHGDIAVSASGEIYVSVETPGAGIQVFAPDGRFLRAWANAPSDLHGFVIRETADGEHLYGATLRGQTIVKMTLDGEVVLEIPRSAIPREHWVENPFSDELGVLLSGLDVAPNGDLYVTDGYSSDYIHRFDKAGKYLDTFGGKAAPYNFDILHKIAMDKRFDPVRIIATDRRNNRVVHLSLDGELLGVVADELLLPAAVTIDGRHAIVAELQGRVTVLDESGNVVARVGENTQEGIGGNQLPPEQWRTGYVVAPHGVATNSQGDLFVAEFSRYGRVHKFDAR